MSEETILLDHLLYTLACAEFHGSSCEVLWVETPHTLHSDYNADPVC